MGVCVAFLRQEADGVWAAVVPEGYRAVCAGCGWRDACHVFRNTGNFSPLAEIAMSCCYCHATLLRRDALSRGSHPERGDRILYSRPKRYFLRKGLTRSSWEVMTQKATTTRATARAAVVSRMKLWRFTRKPPAFPPWICPSRFCRLMDKSPGRKSGTASLL